jgi:hypothetical protein
MGVGETHRQQSGDPTTSLPGAEHEGDALAVTRVVEELAVHPRAVEVRPVVAHPHGTLTGAGDAVCATPEVLAVKEIQQSFVVANVRQRPLAPAERVPDGEHRRIERGDLP